MRSDTLNALKQLWWWFDLAHCLNLVLEWEECMFILWYLSLWLCFLSNALTHSLAFFFSITHLFFLISLSQYLSIYLYLFFSLCNLPPWKIQEPSFHQLTFFSLFSFSLAVIQFPLPLMSSREVETFLPCHRWKRKKQYINWRLGISWMLKFWFLLFYIYLFCVSKLFSFKGIVITELHPVFYRLGKPR